MFGTLLRYGDDTPHPLDLDLRQIEGLVLIDEIDAHMHVDLQHRALPELISMFPKVQFLLSSHSPLFVLGMGQKFGSDGISIIDMPSGTPIDAEAYAEFGRALDVLQQTKAFAAVIEKEAASPGKLLVFMEGETDPIYMRAAAELLGRSAILEKIEFSWVGAKDPKGGQAFSTGKDALNRTLAVLRAKPQLFKRQIVLLYDNDAKKVDADYESVFVRSIPSNPENSKDSAGIENLLPVDILMPDTYSSAERIMPNGTKVVTTLAR